MTQKGQGRDLNILRAKYLENYVTQRGQGHDPNIFGAHYLDNGCRYGLGANGAPIGNDYLGVT